MLIIHFRCCTPHIDPVQLDFLMGGVAAAVSKTAAAPIERVKLLIQNQVRPNEVTRPETGCGAQDAAPARTRRCPGDSSEAWATAAFYPGGRLRPGGAARRPKVSTLRLNAR